MLRPLLFAGILAGLTSPALAQIPPDDHTVQVAPGLHVVTWGPMGLNVGLSVGEDGLLLVDAQDQRALPRLVARMRTISDKPVRFVIDTHWHFDHVGGNAMFKKQGAAIIAQENTRTRLMSAQVNPINGGKQEAFAPDFWPDVTFKESLTLHVNGDEIELLHFPNGHTDGDAVVLFKKADVLFAADLFNNTDYTRVDLRGGTLAGMIDAYDKLLPMLDDSVKVVPGRGPVGTKKDLIAYRGVMIALRDRITKLIKDGKTLEEAVAAKPTADLDADWGNGPIRPDQIVEEVYLDLKRTLH
jgi:glyoxylase-like metal-dependent hydrolase (beta-lactamase superfamily II)